MPINSVYVHIHNFMHACILYVLDTLNITQHAHAHYAAS